MNKRSRNKSHDIYIILSKIGVYPSCKKGAKSYLLIDTIAFMDQRTKCERNRHEMLPISVLLLTCSFKTSFVNGKELAFSKLTMSLWHRFLKITVSLWQQCASFKISYVTVTLWQDPGFLKNQLCHCDSSVLLLKSPVSLWPALEIRWLLGSNTREGCCGPQLS